MREAALIVFQKKAEPGKVKTRLGKSIGDEKAVLVYEYLLEHTHREIAKMSMPVMVFFDKEIQKEYLHDGRFLGFLQSSGDLGFRMKKAFRKVFRMGFQKAIIIGTDCPEMNSDIITQAIDALEKCDMVIGPAIDGGYYLLGLKAFHKKLFENKIWSTETVYQDTIKDAKTLNMEVINLKPLADVDDFEDLGNLETILDIKKL